MLCAGALLLLAVRLLGDDTSQAGAPSPPPAARSAPRAAAPASPGARPVSKHLPRSSPVRLLIPKISVDAPFTDLAVGANGQLQAPPPHNTNLVGWYAKGASPGETGTSVIAGHVDTATSAAVFAELSRLEKGDVFRVRRADGRAPVFVVDSVETFDKDRFPSRRVYADTADAQVRLITCAGDYDRTVKDYTENLVVFAHLR
ncbi:class F sortase [Streptomyces sp. ID05-39B]|uniref:class F sortase n=1 Tax=Streptomyces sp. ID05-39B TaxID=3028664 RepID=UPI0029BC6AB0|nr:class F sortase [Streptomyces sp. ID05-39B]MDX3525645.1 class F sortase [Streptomyces sp. ID05-39B]